MDISVVVATWNNNSMLRSTLEHILACAEPAQTSVEYVVVDNNSTDATKETIETISKAHENRELRYVFEGVQGLGRARQTGLRHARGELVIFSDDDVIPDTGWISAYWKAFKELGASSFFGGPVESIFETALPHELAEVAPASVRGLNFGETSMHLDTTKFTFLAANWAAAREAVTAAGGFDERLGLNSATGATVGEENRLMERLVERGLTPYYVADAALKHHVPGSKTRLAHIARRYQAYRCYRVMTRGRVPRSRWPMISGVPWWTFAGLARSAARYGLRRLTGRPWISAYLAYRGALGELQAVRSLYKTRGDASSTSGCHH